MRTYALTGVPVARCSARPLTACLEGSYRAEPRAGAPAVTPRLARHAPRSRGRRLQRPMGARLRGHVTASLGQWAEGIGRAQGARSMGHAAASVRRRSNNGQKDWPVLRFHFEFRIEFPFDKAILDA